MGGSGGCPRLRLHLSAALIVAVVCGRGALSSAQAPSQIFANPPTVSSENGHLEVDLTAQAGEAVADAEIVTTVLKDATKRVRPAGFPAQGGNLYDSWLESRGSFVRGNGSFPSGHTITAFAVAISVGLFYPQLLVCLLAAAFLIAASRIILGMHFLSDVLAGGVLGTALGFLSFHIFTLL